MDSYGGMGRHGGGCFSGKDPSKVDRSAAYMGRYVAKNIVAAGLATSAEIQFAYAIGYPDPVSVCVNTFGTGVVSDEEIERAVARGVQLQAGGHHQAAQPAAPDLFQDHQLRPLRQERPGHHLGEDRQSRRRCARRPANPPPRLPPSTLKKAAALVQAPGGSTRNAYYSTTISDYQASCPL